MKPNPTLDVARLPTDSQVLIEASAGTGKTHTLATLYVRLFLERGLDVSQILVVTYTRAATAELRARIRARLRETIRALDTDKATDPELLSIVRERISLGSQRQDRLRLEGAGYALEVAPILTIHGFCDRILREHSLAADVDPLYEVREDISQLLREMTRRFFEQRTYQAPAMAAGFLEANGVTEDALMRLFYNVESSGAELIVPERATDLSSLATTWERLASEVYAVWRAGREELAETLLSSPALNRNRYRRASVESTWLPALDSNALVAGALPQWFERLRADVILNSTKRGHVPPRHVFFEKCEALANCDAEVRQALTTWLAVFQRDYVASCQKQLQDTAARESFLTFDQMLQQAHQLVTAPQNESLVRHLRQSFPAALVDEFQDTDLRQHEIFQTIYGGQAPLFMIGDPKQAIYGFRGADVFAYLKAAEDTPRFSLQTNWRSDPELVRAVNTLFSRVTDPFVLEELRFERVVAARNQAETPRPGMQFLWWDGPTTPKGAGSRDAARRELPRLVAAHLEAELTDPDIAPDDIAVLCRTNAQARAIHEALSELRIPVVLDADASVFNSPEAEGLAWVLAAVITPTDSGLIRRALAGKLFALSIPELLNLREDDESWSRWRDRFAVWNQIWDEQGFAVFAESLLAHGQIEARFCGGAQSDRANTNLSQLLELLHKQARATHAAPHELLQWFETNLRGQQRGSIPAAFQQRPETDKPSVRVTTVHKSKGLEFQIVYCPYLWDEFTIPRSELQYPKFHDPQANGALRIDLGSAELEAAQEHAKHEALAESMRLLYVALTRARSRCLVVWGPLRGCSTAPLSRLLHGENRKLSPEQMRSDLAALQQAAEGTIAIAPLDEPLPHQRFESATILPEELARRIPSRRFELGTGVTSFSALVEDSPVDTPLLRATTSLRFGLVPPGKSSGRFLHEVLEGLDFGAVGAEPSKTLLAAKLSKFGFDPELQAAVLHDLHAVVHAKLPAGFRLAEVEPKHRLDEFEFVMAPPATNGSHLKHALVTTLGTALGKGVRDRLDRIPEGRLRGFLRGFIDALLCVADRWYVVDYKSNALSDYTDDSLRAAMIEHDYALQYYLYTLATHRYLQRRQPDYDYDRHFGGVMYLFLRGVQDGHGVFFDRPEAQAISSLDALFESGAYDAA